MRFFLAALALLFAIQVPSTAAVPPAKPLPVDKIVIDTRSGPRVFMVEVAADDISRDYGLMRRQKLAPAAGMLFDFQKPLMASFWMKDTPLPLDLLFVRADGTVSSIAANAVPFSLAEIFSAEPIRVVIEINGGLAKKLGIAPGDRVRGSVFGNLR